MFKRMMVVALLGSLSVACGPAGDGGSHEEDQMTEMEAKLAQYETVRLTTDISRLSEAERAMIPLLVEAAVEEAPDGGEALMSLYTLVRRDENGDLYIIYKAAHEAFILVKDRAWSDRLARYAEFLPALQEGLPVPPEYKAERPGTDSDLNAYDVVYVGGDANAGSKTIAINLPNDPEVQFQRGARRLQLKNAMRAKFDRILVPIAEVLMAEDQRAMVDFDAFFENTMFHEGAQALWEEFGTMRPRLQADLDRLADLGLPVDIVYEQRLDVMGLGG